MARALSGWFSLGGWSRVAAALLTAAGLCGSASAGPPSPISILDLFNTGVSGSGTALSQNDTDTHWTVTASPTDVSGTVPNFYNGSARADWFASWTNATANTGSSTWITAGNAIVSGTDFGGQAVNGNLGLYTFRTTFTIPEAFTSASIKGLWAADNFGGQVLDYNDNTPVVTTITNFIKLNGNTISPGKFQYSFTENDFTISSDFVVGTNTLEFNVSNLIGDGVPNPIGTQIKFTEAVFTPVPEPAVGVLAMTACGILAATRWQRRRKATTQV